MHTMLHRWHVRFLGPPSGFLEDSMCVATPAVYELPAAHLWWAGTAKSAPLPVWGGSPAGRPSRQRPYLLPGPDSIGMTARLDITCGKALTAADLPVLPDTVSSGLRCRPASTDQPIWPYIVAYLIVVAYWSVPCSSLCLCVVSLVLTSIAASVGCCLS